MFFRMVYDNSLAQAAYVIGCQRTGEAVVIDPQRDVDRYTKLAAAEKLRITAVAETHIHADYLSGVRELAEATGAKVFVSDEGDVDWKYEWVNKPTAKGGSYTFELLKDGSTFRVGNIELTALHTPGHTPEHLCFLVTDKGGGADQPMGIVTGDFVFVGDMGRPDLLETAAGIPGVKEASAATLYESVKRFNALPDWLQVWPGHGAGSACGKALGAVPQSTVGYEKRFNSALAAAREKSLFMRAMLEGQPEPPLYFARMKRDNKLGPAVLGGLPAPRELSAAELKCVDARKTAVLDLRPWARFRAGHVSGSMHAPLNTTFATIAGSFVEDGESVVLICEPGQIDDAVRCLVRVGLDQVTGFATPETLNSAANSGLKLKATPEIDVNALRAAMADPQAFVLDVRRAAEHEAGHIADTLNLAHTRLRAHLDEVPRGRLLYVHCQGGTRSAHACSLLERAGYEPTNIAGGFGAWQKAGLPVEQAEPAGVAGGR